MNRPVRRAEPAGSQAELSPVVGESGRIYERIFDAIADQRLPPGTKLGEDKLGQIFGVNRTQIRQVLVRLAHDKIVALSPNRGAFVARPTIEETREVIGARRLIETHTVAVAAAAASSGQLAALRDNIERERRCWANHERHAATRLSRMFHLLIAEIAGNRVVVEMLREVISRASLAMALYNGPGSPDCYFEEHVDVLGALEAQDAEAAVEAMNRHLDHLERRFDVLQVDPQAVNLEKILAE